MCIRDSGSLILLVAASVLFLAGSTALDRAKEIFLLVTIVWFIAAAAWMWKEK